MFYVSSVSFVSPANHHMPKTVLFSDKFIVLFAGSCLSSYCILPFIYSPCIMYIV